MKKRKRRKRLTKAGALLLALAMVFSTLLTIAPQVLASDTNVVINEGKDGELTIYKLDANGLTEAQRDAEIDASSGSLTSSDYYVNEDSDGSKTYHKYLDGAEYTIYLIGTIKQTTDNGNVKVQYVDANDDSIVLDLDNLDTYVSGKDLDNDYWNKAAITGSGVFDKGQVVFDNLDLGLYYVKETETPTGYAVANNFYVQIPMTNANGTAWNYEVEAYPKNNDNGNIVKEITSGTTKDGDKETASLGSTVGYNIAATTPSNLIASNGTVNYENFWITDKASKYLTVDVTSVKVTAENSSQETVNLIVEDDYTIDQVLYNDKSGDGTYNYTYVKFNEAGLKKLGNSAVVTVTYSAAIAVNVDAASTVEFDNAVYFQYKVDGKDTIGQKDNETVYTYSYSAQKVDDKFAALDKATFVLAQNVSGNRNYLTYDDKDGWGYSTDIAQAYKVSSSDGTDSYEKGLFAFRGLKAGDYILIETNAPSGYTLLKDPISITISSSTTDTANSITNNKYDSYTIQIVNNKNGTIQLPTTGGKGIYMFIIIGAALMAIAVVIYVKNRKKIK